MMLWIELGLFSVGVFLGWLLRVASMEDRIGRLDLTGEARASKFISEMLQTDALLQSSDAHTDLDLLLRLEAGLVSEAKTLLLQKLGLFYHRWTSKPCGNVESEDIQRALFRIRETAKDCKLIEEVLTYRPKNEFPSV